MTESFKLPTGYAWQLQAHINSKVPTLEVIEGVDSFDHGTFQTHPYYAFMPDPEAADGETPKMLLVSDNGLIAELTYIEGSSGKNECGNLGAKFRVKVREPLQSALRGNDDIVLSFNDHHFHPGDRPGFNVTGSPEDCLELPSGPHPTYSYYTSRKKGSSGMTQTWGDVFVHRPFGLEVIARSFNAIVMDVENFQNTFDAKVMEALPPGRMNRVRPDKHVLKFPDAKSKDYDSLPPVPVPYGWRYLARSAARGSETSRMVSTSADVMNSVKREAGFHIKSSVEVNVGPVGASANFSVTRNKAVADKIQNVTESEQTVTEHRIVQTEFALILDKRNARLDDEFHERIVELRRAYEEKKGLSDTELDDFFDNWGTHFVYAATFGAKGKSTQTYGKDTMGRLIESQVDLKSAWSAGVSLKVFGAGGSLDGGEDRASSETNHNQLKNVTGTGFDSWDCVGGGSCSKDGPGSGTNRPPIYLDLRPLSDLLGPPFYFDSLTAVTLRGLVAKGIDRYAFVPSTDFGEAPFSACEIEFSPVGVGVDPSFSALGEVGFAGPVVGFEPTVVAQGPLPAPLNQYQKGYWTGVGTQGSTRFTVFHGPGETIDVGFAMLASTQHMFSGLVTSGWNSGSEGTFSVDPAQDGPQHFGPFKAGRSDGQGPGIQLTFQATARKVDIASLLGLRE